MVKTRTFGLALDFKKDSVEETFRSTAWVKESTDFRGANF